MAVNLSLIGGAGWQFFDDNGAPLSGGKIYTYVAGTTTPLTTYTSRDGLTANANPIILDAAGRTPQQIWSTEGLLYKYVVTKSNDVQIRVWDNIGGTVVASNLSADLSNTTDNSKGDALIGFCQSDSFGFLTGATARTVNDKLQEFISVKDFGAVPDIDSVDASVANVTAFQNAATAATALNKDLFVPSGTYWITANNGVSTGLTFNIAANETLRIIGDSGTTIKRRPTATLASTSSLIWLTANTGVTYEWHGITLDGNEINCPYDAGTPYAHEQSANMKWRTGTGTPNAIRFFNCDVGKNRVGDGYQSNIRVNYFMATHCSTNDESVRRVRADWQFSRYATYDTMMSNIACNSWESEPFDTQENSRLFLSNVQARSVFDLAGDSSGATQRPVLAQLTNVSCMRDANRAGLPYVNFYRVHGSAINCNFRGIERLQQCKLEFIGGSITVRDAGAGVAEGVQVWHDQSSELNTAITGRFSNFVEFNGVQFLKDTAVTSGQYVQTEGTVEAANVTAGVNLVRLSVINCSTPEALDYVVRSARSGNVEIRGGTLRALNGICFFGNDTTRVANLHIEPNMLWASPALMYNTLSIDSTTGSTSINMSGVFNGETMTAWGNGGVAVSTGGNIAWNTTAIAIVTSNPQGRILTVPGLRAKKYRLSWGEPSMWQAINVTGNDTSYNATTWRAIEGGGRKGTTANRPVTLSTYDAGFIYLDTTLDANGNPIWWNGVAWVNATGAIV